MRILYHIFIHIFRLILLLASLFNDKARKWVKGRKQIFEQLKNAISADDKIIWVHSASLGEFEQGKPIIEGLKQQHPGHKILLTFFSPSGYEVRKNYEFADSVFYLPIDTLSNAHIFVEIVKPQMAIFVKYEFWFNYISVLEKHHIPIIFISSIFRSNQYFFRFYAEWFRKQLVKVSHYFVQNSESKHLLNKIGVEQVTVCGDTRFDSVFKLAQNAKKFEIVEKFKGDNPLIIAGSTWPPDEDMLISLIEKFQNHKFIIVPHEVREVSIKQTQNRIGDKSVLFSSAQPKTVNNFQVLIVDSIGKLAHLYQYANLAYIGGGFGSGLHNIQEPITFGIPVVFGPKFQNFQEAVDLVRLKGAFTVKNKEELEKIFSSLLMNKEVYKNACQTNKAYLNKNIGASGIILKYLQQLIED